jgi:hypothetical protein
MIVRLKQTRRRRRERRQRADNARAAYNGVEVNPMQHAQHKRPRTPICSAQRFSNLDCSVMDLAVSFDGIDLSVMGALRQAATVSAVLEASRVVIVVMKGRPESES